jgi:TolB-like protein
VALRITNLFNELRRRRVFRMTGWYVVASWVLVQVASEALPALNLDESFIKYFWLAALGGFPIAVIFSWRYDVTSRGIKRTPAGIEAAPEALRLGRADYLLLGALAVLAGIGVYGLSQKAAEEVALIEATPETREIRQQSIAVLPLENLSPESTEQYFVTGMYDSLISNLGKINALQVTSRTSASRVNTSQGIPYVGRKLGVRYVIEGAVYREGNRIRISVKLIDTLSDQHVWSETYERPFDDVMAVQASVARTVARIVQAKLTSQDEEQLARIVKIRPETFESYLRAMYQYQKETQEGYQKGIEILEEALENDPTSALAYAALGQGYSELVHSVLPVMEAMKRARAAVEKAVELDPTLAEAHLALAMKQLYGDFDFEASEQSLKKAIELNPSLADAWYHWAWWLEMRGFDDEAIEAGLKTVELSPLSSFYLSWLADQYRDAGDNEKAIELAESVLALSPTFPVAWYALGNVYLDQGRYEEAIAAHTEISHLPFWAFALGQTLAWAGQPEKALEVAQTYGQEPENAIPLTIIYAALGDVEKTVHWSGIAREQRLPWAIALFSCFTAPRSLYKDPRIQQEAALYPTPLVPYPKD